MLGIVQTTGAADRSQAMPRELSSDELELVGGGLMDSLNRDVFGGGGIGGAIGAGVGFALAGPAGAVAGGFVGAAVGGIVGAVAHGRDP